MLAVLERSEEALVARLAELPASRRTAFFEALTPAEASRLRDIAQTLGASPTTTAANLLTMAGKPPDDWQVRLFEGSARRRLVLGGRQIGKTEACCAAILETALTVANSVTVVISRTERQAIRLLVRARRMLKKILANGHNVLMPTNREVRSITFPNGSVILALPGSPDNVRGETADRVVIEEGAFVADAIYEVVSPFTATTGGDMLVISSAGFEVGWFHEAVTSGGPDWDVQIVPSSSCPRIPDEFLDAERRRLPSHVFMREYECVFTAASGSVFRAEDIDAMLACEFESTW